MFRLTAVVALLMLSLTDAVNITEPGNDEQQAANKFGSQGSACPTANVTVDYGMEPDNLTVISEQYNETEEIGVVLKNNTSETWNIELELEAVENTTRVESNLNESITEVDTRLRESNGSILQEATYVVGTTLVDEKTLHQRLKQIRQSDVSVTLPGRNFTEPLGFHNETTTEDGLIERISEEDLPKKLVSAMIFGEDFEEVQIENATEVTGTTNASNLVEHKKDVEVVFHPGFDGSVRYEFFRTENETLSGIADKENVVNESGMGVQGFAGLSTYEHLNVENGTEASYANNESLSVNETGKEAYEEEDVEVTSPSTTTPTHKNTTANVCVPGSVCYVNEDCGRGRCLGLAVGKCNCAACLSLVACTCDRTCGGLNGACDPITKLCDCARGFRHNGYKNYFEALQKVCNIRECRPNSDSCFGLPCNKGFCAC